MLIYLYFRFVIWSYSWAYSLDPNLWNLYYALLMVLMVFLTSFLACSSLIVANGIALKSVVQMNVMAIALIDAIQLIICSALVFSFETILQIFRCVRYRVWKIFEGATKIILGKDYIQKEYSDQINYPWFPDFGEGSVENRNMTDIAADEIVVEGVSRLMTTIIIVII